MSDFIPVGIALGTGIAEGEKQRAKKKAAQEAENAPADSSGEEETDGAEHTEE